MPFTITDQALQQLDSASEDEKRSLVDRLDDTQAGELATAYKAWKAKGTGAVTSREQAPVAPAGGAGTATPYLNVAGYGQPEPEPGVRVEPSLHDQLYGTWDDAKEGVKLLHRKAVKGLFGIPEDVTAAAQENRRGAGSAVANAIRAQGVDPHSATGAFTLFGKNVASPAREAVQGALRPGLEKAIQADKAITGALGFSEGAQAARSTIQRSLLSTFGGTKLMEDASDSEKLHGVNFLESYLGTKGTALTLGIGEQIGQLPLFMTGGRLITAGAKAAEVGMAAKLGKGFLKGAPTLARVLSRAAPVAGGLGAASVEGALYGGAQSALTGEDVGEGAKQGAIMGPLMAAGGMAAGIGLKAAGRAIKETAPVILGTKRAPQALGLMTPEAYGVLARELEMVRVEHPENVRVLKPEVVESSKSSWTPGYAHIAPNETGDLVGYLTKLNGETGKVETVPFPLTNERKRLRWRAQLDRHGLTAELSHPGDMPMALPTKTMQHITGWDRPAMGPYEKGVGPRNEWDVALRPDLDAPDGPPPAKFHAVIRTKDGIKFVPVESVRPGEAQPGMQAGPEAPRMWGEDTNKPGQKALVLSNEKTPVARPTPEPGTRTPTAIQEPEPTVVSERSLKDAKDAARGFAAQGDGSVSVDDLHKQGFSTKLALEALTGLQQDGHLTPSRPGLWRGQGGAAKLGPVPADTYRVAKPGEFSVKPGDQVYVGKAGSKRLVRRVVDISEDGKTVTVRGGARGQGKPVRVRIEEVYPHTPPGVMDIKDLVPARPEAPPPPQLGDMPPETIKRVEVAVDLFQRQAGKDPSAWEKFKKATVGVHLRAPEDLGQTIITIQALKAMEQSKLDLFKHLQTKLGSPELLSEFSKDLGKYARGEIPEQALDKYGSAWADGKAAFEGAMAERDMWHQKFVERGIVPDKTYNAGPEEIMQYLANMYWQHLLPKGEWAKLVPRDAIQDMVTKIVKAMPAKRAWTESQISAELMSILHMDDPLTGLVEHKAFGKAFGHLQSKNPDLDPVVAKFLGRVDSGPLLLAESLGSQRTIGALLDAWDHLALDKRYWSPGPRDDLPVKIPNDARYGNAKGGYTTAEVGEALVGLHDRLQKSHPAIRAALGFVKGNQVATGGVGPLLNAMINNTFFYSVYAGGMDPFHPVRSGVSYAKAVKALFDYHRNPVDPQGLGKWVIEARKMGVDLPGFGGTEIAGPHRQFLNEYENAFSKVESGTLWDQLKVTGEVAMTLAKKGYAKSGWLYDHIDRSSKLANYIALKERYMTGGPLTGAPMGEADAARKAAYRIAQSFPDPSRLGSAIDKWRNSAVGVAANYFTYTAEDMRVHASLPKRMLEEPDLRWRVLAATIGGAALWEANGILRRMNGITDQEADDAKKQFSDRFKTHRPWMTAAAWRDSQGRPQFWDITPYNQMLRLADGHPDDALWQKVIANLIASPFHQPATGVNPARGLLELVGLVRPIDGQRPLIEGEAGLTKAMQFLWRNGILGPTVIPKTMELVRKAGGTGSLGKYEEPLTPGQAVGKALGAPIAGSVGEKTPVGSAMEAVGGELDLQGQLRMLITSPEFLALPQEERLKRIAPIVRRMQEIGNKQADRSQALERLQQGAKQ